MDKNSSPVELQPPALDKPEVADAAKDGEHAKAAALAANADAVEVAAYKALSGYARAALGPEQWSLLRFFGKVMDGGPLGGLYVSGLVSHEARLIVDELVAGEVVEIHLMHRHRSGHYEASSLCRRNGRLIMLFDGRSEFA